MEDTGARIRMEEMKMNDFVQALSSKAPIPGGGGTCAMVAALAMALGNMVGNLTTGKKRYAAVEEEIRQLLVKGLQLQNELLELIEADAKGFEPLARAYGLPKETEEERKNRDSIMEAALQDAIIAPLSIMKKSIEGLRFIQRYAQIGSILAVSDAGVGAQLFLSAIKGAALNVYINTKMLKDIELAKRLNQEAFAIEEQGLQIANTVYEQVREKLLPKERK